MPGSPPPPPPVLPPSSVDAPAPLSSPLPGDALRPRGDRPRKSRLYCNNAIPTLALNMASFFYHGGSWRAVHSSSICCVIFFSAGECLFVVFFWFVRDHRCGRLFAVDIQWHMFCNTFNDDTMDSCNTRYHTVVVVVSDVSLVFFFVFFSRVMEDGSSGGGGTTDDAIRVHDQVPRQISENPIKLPVRGVVDVVVNDDENRHNVG